MLIYKRGATGLTGRALARALGVRAVADDRLERARPPRDGATLIRWGTNVLLPPRWRHRTIINADDAVALARNKKWALEVMAQDEVRVPPFATEGPAIGRTLYHQGGAGLVVFERNQPLRGCDYYLKLVPSDREYRVHVVGERVIATQKKYHVGEPTGHQKIVRNYDNGWRFRVIRERDWLTPHALRAVAALGLDFGAVDLLHSPNGNVFVLEVNTAPGIHQDGIVFQRYVEAMGGLINGLPN